MDTDEDWMDPVESYPGPPFEAHLSGTCTDCGCHIRPGEVIRQTGEREYAHAMCLRLASRPVVW